MKILQFSLILGSLFLAAIVRAAEEEKVEDREIVVYNLQDKPVYVLDKEKEPPFNKYQCLITTHKSPDIVLSGEVQVFKRCKKVKSNILTYMNLGEYNKERYYSYRFFQSDAIKIELLPDQTEVIIEGVNIKPAKR